MRSEPSQRIVSRSFLGALGAAALFTLAHAALIRIGRSVPWPDALTVAATNATLAWLGGGTLATGGLGVAGGTMMLGGIVASPLLLVTGLALSAKGKQELENARGDAAKVRVAVAEMATVREVMKAVAARAWAVPSAWRTASPAGRSASSLWRSSPPA